MLNKKNCLVLMSITKYLLPVTLAYSTLAYAAEQSQITNLKLNEVTVYLRGAELFNSAQINLPAGESEVVFTNVASDINEKTLIIGTNSKAVVKSSVIQRNYLAKNTSDPEIKKLEAQMNEVHDKLLQLDIERQVIEGKLSFINNNIRAISDNRSVNVDDVKGMWEFADTKMKEALVAKAKLTKERKGLEKQLNVLRRQIQGQKTKNIIPGNQLVVTFYTDKAITTDVNLSYAINNANWIPTYDITVDKINQPVQFTYKASIVQGSGINWDNVRLKLSTSNLSQSAQAPKLQPSYIRAYDHRTYPNSWATGYDEQYFKMNDSAATANVPAQSANKTVKQMNGNEAKQRERALINQYVVTNVDDVNITFDIALPYSIPSDEEPHLVSIKEMSTQGEYRYYTVPKLSSSAYLQVQIKDWEKLDLLPGKSNVFFEGSFVGEGMIHPQNYEEEMSISLGRDNKIVVSRENVGGVKSKPRLLGNTITQHFDYQVNIRNTRPEAIKLVVVDQIPISKDASVIINEVKFDKNGQWNKSTGEIEWLMDVKESSTETLSLAYMMKYPKNKLISGL